MTAKSSKLLVAAIDFGTAYSGYAFSFKQEYDVNPTKIFAKTSWEGGAALSEKTLTCILFDKTRKFHSYGYAAEDKYADLALRGEHKDWLFFKWFKMKLHNAEVRRDMLLEADNGQKMSAMTVFGESIQYMKQSLLRDLHTQGTGVDNKDIHWVLTVPAIWTDAAKQFMREAAEYAGIERTQLSIALEPEAASLYCQMISADKVRGSMGARKDISIPGTKFMVIDLGGGTADITVHMKQADDSLKELHKPDGGSWGGMEVDAEFERTFIKIIGAPVFVSFCKERKDDHILLQRDFESLKRRIKATTTEKMNLRVPISIAEAYKNQEGEDITTGLAKSLFSNKVEWIRDKLIINADILHGFFESCAKNVVQYIKKILSAPEVNGTNIFLLVGGFSESDIMQDAIKKAFPNVQMIIPEESGLAVVKGAVIYGHRPVRISTRVTKYTYGVNISPPFDPKKHPEDHKVEVGGLFRCRDVFKPYIKLGKTMNLGQSVKYNHVSLKSSQTQMQLKLYASEKENPQFVDEEDTRLLGKLVVDLPQNIDKITVEVKLIFGETELGLEARELSTGTKYTAYFDFL